MKVLVEIPDNKISLAMEVLHSLTFIKKVKPLSASTSKLWDDLRGAAEEVRLHKQGKIKLKTAQELLNEL